MLNLTNEAERTLFRGLRKMCALNIFAIFCKISLAMLSKKRIIKQLFFIKI